MDLLHLRYAHVRSSNRNSSSHNEVNLATVLICIVIMFLLCHSPRLIINVAELIISRSYSACEHWVPPAWFLCLTSFMHWLLIVNSSSSFLIYCFMGQKFKQVLLTKVRRYVMCEHTTLLNTQFSSDNRIKVLLMRSTKVSQSIVWLSPIFQFIHLCSFRFWRITESSPKRNNAANLVREEGDKRTLQTEKNVTSVIKSVTATTNLLESKV